MVVVVKNKNINARSSAGRTLARCTALHASHGTARRDTAKSLGPFDMLPKRDRLFVAWHSVTRARRRGLGTVFFLGRYLGRVIATPQLGELVPSNRAAPILLPTTAIPPRTSALRASFPTSAVVAGVGKRSCPAPAKTFMCSGFGECRVFSRSDCLARHPRPPAPSSTLPSPPRSPPAFPRIVLHPPLHSVILLASPLARIYPILARIPLSLSCPSPLLVLPAARPALVLTFPLLPSIPCTSY
ncbi:hypothetical protein FB451DRAFT_1406529 [Mycena latifolia]|nr:hypothetical protein FB451DRAFT_1406529 [Mycena latifolia]